MRVASFFLSLAFMTALASPTHDARAGDPTADDLFREGVQLNARGEIHAACEKFDQSYKLDPAPGTLFNLARCHENDGHLWQSRQEYRELVDRATAAGKADKADLARSRLAAVEARLPRIQLVFPAASNVAAITVDGSALATADWTQPVVVDVGAHTIELSAPGKAGVTRTVTAPDSPDSVPLEVPVLVDVQSGAASSGPSAGNSSSASSAPTGSEPPPGLVPAPTSSRRTIGLVVGGAGVLGLGVGAAFGLVAISQRNDASSACGSSTRVCPTTGQKSAAESRLDDARTSGWVSTISFAVGAAALGLGAYLFLSAPSSTSQTGFVVVPALAPGGGGLAIVGRM
jgi:hypothetical protein